MPSILTRHSAGATRARQPPPGQPPETKTRPVHPSHADGRNTRSDTTRVRVFPRKKKQRRQQQGTRKEKLPENKAKVERRRKRKEERRGNEEGRGEKRERRHRPRRTSGNPPPLLGGGGGPAPTSLGRGLTSPPGSELKTDPHPRRGGRPRTRAGCPPASSGRPH